MDTEGVIEKSVYITAGPLVTEPTDNIETVKRIKTVLRSEELILGAIDGLLKKASWVERASTGVVLGADNAIDECKEEYYRGVLAEGPLGASPLSFPYTSANAITAQTTIAFGFHHETFTVTDGPASFQKAAALSFDLIRTGVCKAVVTGGFSQKAAFAMLLQEAVPPDGAPHRTVKIIETETDALADDAARFNSIEESFEAVSALIESKDGVIKGVDKRGGNVVIIEIGNLTG